MRQCSICGASAKRTYCKACQAAYSRQWYAANKEQTLLKNKTRSQAILKWLSAAQRKLYGMAKVKTEVAKCSVLCANCHRIHHHQNKGIA